MQNAAARLAVTVSNGEVPNCERLSALVNQLRSPVAVVEALSERRQHEVGRSLSHQPEPEPEPQASAATAESTEDQEAMSELGRFLSAEYLERVQARRHAAFTTNSAVGGAVAFPLQGLSAGGATRAEPLRLSPSSRESSHPTPSPAFSVEPDPSPSSLEGRLRLQHHG